MAEIKWQIYAPENSNFRFILIDVYSKSSGRNQLADLPLQKTAISDSY